MLPPNGQLGKQGDVGNTNLKLDTKQSLVQPDASQKNKKKDC